MENKFAGMDLILITKYLNHEADAFEIEKVNLWIASSAENKTEYKKLQTAWELATAEIGIQEWDAGKSKEQFLLKVIKEQTTTIDRIETSIAENRKFIRNLMKYAATILSILAISSLLFYSIYNNSRGKSLIAQPFTQISAAKGSKTTMTMADGTKVWLNAGSNIKYNADYNKHDREIFLEGEAYFEVAKNPDKAFHVYADKIVVHALGTKFNVKAYAEENVVETTLIEGSVSVDVKSLTSQRVFLKPKEQVFYYKPVLQQNGSEKILVSKGINPALYTSWINDQLMISNETLESLTVKLGRKYDVVFHFEDNSLRKLRFTGLLENETIEQILEVLKLSSSVNYRINERQIWIIKKNTGQ